MRSRYSAFVLGDDQYLSSSWHPATRPAELVTEAPEQWQSLRVLDSGSDGDSGWVHFQACFRAAGAWGVLEERSEFRRVGGHWLYLQGNHTIIGLNPGRNEPCPCGSGRKFKRCCKV